MVAEAAGPTKPSVYSHFADNATLLVASACSVRIGARSGTEEILAGPGSFRDRLVAVAVNVVGMPHAFAGFDLIS